MKKIKFSTLHIVQLSLIGVVFAFIGCASSENTAKSWVGKPLQRLEKASGSDVKKAYLQSNGNWVYVTSDSSQSECKTYWEVNDQNIIVSFRRERSNWKCD